MAPLGIPKGDAFIAQRRKKAQGDVVEWAEPQTHYDIIFQSKIFKSSPDVPDVYHADRW